MSMAANILAASANQALSAARAPVEHGFSDLKNWRILTRLRLSPAKATTLLRALLVLTRRPGLTAGYAQNFWIDA